MSMHTTVFVDGLAPQLTNERLQAFFHPYGSLRVIMATSKAGANLGFAFVVFASPAQAAHAIEVLNGAELLGKRLRVSAKISPRPPVNAA